jgi:hypothetical protein
MTRSPRPNPLPRRQKPLPHDPHLWDVSKELKAWFAVEGGTGVHFLEGTRNPAASEHPSAPVKRGSTLGVRQSKTLRSTAHLAVAADGAGNLYTGGFLVSSAALLFLVRLGFCRRGYQVIGLLELGGRRLRFRLRLLFLLRQELVALLEE